LDTLGIERREPGGGERFEAVFSVVIDRSERQVRKLPSLYFGRAQIHGGRDLAGMRERLQRTIEVAQLHRTQAIYALHACEFEGARGLYARDLYSRSSFRVRISRLGMKFADDPYVRLLDNGTFQCDDWGEFAPTFSILLSDWNDAAETRRVEGALVAFSLASYRFGLVEPAELPLLTRASLRSPGVAGGTAEGVVDELERMISEGQ
jgi:hypothetical protein